MTYKSTNLYWITSGILNTLQNASGVVFGFGTFFMLVRMLSEADFGAWTLFLSSITILEIVRSGLVQNALIKYVSGAEPDEHPEIIAASSLITLILTGACIFVNLGFALVLPKLWNSPQLVSVFYIYNIAFILSGVVSQFNCIEQANLKFKGIFVSSFIRSAVFFFYILVCYVLELEVTLVYLVIIQIIALLISLLASYHYAKPYLMFKLRKGSVWTKKLFNYGKYSFGTSVSAILANTIDQMMLGALISPNAAGAFNIAIRITNLIDIPTNAIAAIVFPQSAKRIETEGIAAVKYLYEKSVGTLLAILFPGILFLYIFSDFVVEMISGTKYPETIPLLHITLVYCILIPYGRQVGTILDSIGKTRLNFFLVLMTATINLGLNYPLIELMGITGVAYASLFAGIIGFIVAQITLKKLLGVNVLNTFVYAIKFYPEFYHKYVKHYIRKKRF